jgi:hypothetical protein
MSLVGHGRKIMGGRNEEEEARQKLCCREILDGDDVVVD